MDGLLETLTDLKKLKRYPEALSAYKKFVRSKEIKWFDPPSSVWNAADLHVKVNPELGLTLNGMEYVVKLYFKDEPLTKRRLAVVLQMMKATFNDNANSQRTMAVLEVGKGKLLPLEPGAPDITPLLLGEAASFVAIWNAI